MAGAMKWSWNSRVFETLRELAPNVAILVEWRHDPNYQWDGDGSDPVDDGYEPYTVTVWSNAIVDGRNAQGESHLTGFYAIPGEFDQNIGGYMMQLVDKSLDDLYQQASNNKTVREQVVAAKKYISEKMSKRAGM